MPELPEMQALAERLDERLTGTTVVSLGILQFSALKTVAPAPSDLAGEPIAGCTRRGKYLLVTVGSGTRLVVHLSQGGRVDVEDPAKASQPRQAVARLTVAGLDEPEPIAILVKEFGTERRASCWVLEAGDPGPLERLGPDPFDDAFERLVLEGDDGRRLHTFLRDQKTVAGIGRGYTDDILHAARLSPFATLKGLDDPERARLVATTRTILDQALGSERERRGGLPTKLGDRFRVHRRFGDACPECDETLQRVSYESYEIVYCPRCQTGGKVLADRRTSRFVR